MKLIDVLKTFSDEERCLAHLEALRWPEGVECLKCGSKAVSKFITETTTRQRKSQKTGKMETKTVPARRLYQCRDCKHQFAATTGTIFHDTHLPVGKWFVAVALLADAKKGMSALQVQRHMTENENSTDPDNPEKKPAYKTVWYLCHRIRKAMEQQHPGRITTVAEVDETYVGGAYDRRRHRAKHDKAPVVGVLKRKTEDECSQVRAKHVPNVGGKTLVGIVKASVSPRAELVCTDEARAYTNLGEQGYNHETVTHIALEYVRKGDKRIHTNGIENFWSLFKRGVIGSYHQVSVKHLRRYLDEFTFRFNNREAEDLFQLTILNLLIGEAIKYSELTAKADEEPAAEGQRREFQRRAILTTDSATSPTRPSVSGKIVP